MRGQCERKRLEDREKMGIEAINEIDAIESIEEIEYEADRGIH